jgi:hypothetical protein
MELALSRDLFERAVCHMRHIALGRDVPSTVVTEQDFVLQSTQFVGPIAFVDSAQHTGLGRGHCDGLLAGRGNALQRLTPREGLRTGKDPFARFEFEETALHFDLTLLHVLQNDAVALGRTQLLKVVSRAQGQSQIGVGELCKHSTPRQGMKIDDQYTNSPSMCVSAQCCAYDARRLLRI